MSASAVSTFNKRDSSLHLSPDKSSSNGSVSKSSRISSSVPTTTTTITNTKTRSKDTESDNASTKSKQSRRRSISAFTFHSNHSFDQQKRRSFSSVRNSMNIPNTSNNNGINSSNNTSNSLMNPLVIDKRRSSIINTKQKSTAASRFFSSPQFSTSTPNLTPKQTKYLDTELKKAHKSVTVDNVELIIPAIVEKCSAHILSNPPVEGTFRMNGSIKQVNIIETELNKNLNTYDFTSDQATTIHDVAVVLKRWISKLDDGLLTPMVIDSLTMNQKCLFSDDYPSDIEDTDIDQVNNDNLINTHNIVSSELNPLQDTRSISLVGELKDLSDENIDEDIVDMTNSIDLLQSPSKPESIVTPERRRPYLYDYKSSYSSALIKLPIENLHLVLFVLHFLHKLSQPEISEITKMHTSNLAKVFQLNFFKSVDLTFGTKSFSTEDLKFSYTTNEELLTNLIDNIPTILNDVKNYIINEKTQMQQLLNSTSTSSPFKSSFSNYILSGKRNASTQSFTSTDNLPKSSSRTKDLNKALEPCIERESAPSTAPETTRSQQEKIEDLDISDATVLKEIENLDPVQQSQNTLRKDSSASSRKQHAKRKSVFNFFSRKSSIASDSIVSSQSEQTTFDSVNVDSSASEEIRNQLKTLDPIDSVPVTADLENEDEPIQSPPNKQNQKRFSLFKFKRV